MKRTLFMMERFIINKQSGVFCSEDKRPLHVYVGRDKGFLNMPWVSHWQSRFRHSNVDDWKYYSDWTYC